MISTTTIYRCSDTVASFIEWIVATCAFVARETIGNRGQRYNREEFSSHGAAIYTVPMNRQQRRARFWRAAMFSMEEEWIAILSNLVLYVPYSTVKQEGQQIHAIVNWNFLFLSQIFRHWLPCQNNMRLSIVKIKGSMSGKYFEVSIALISND